MSDDTIKTFSPFFTRGSQAANQDDSIRTYKSVAKKMQSSLLETDQHIPEFYARIFKQFHAVIELCEYNIELSDILIEDFYDYLAYLKSLVEKNEVAVSKYRVQKQQQLKKIERRLGIYDSFEKELLLQDKQLIAKIRRATDPEIDANYSELFAQDLPIAATLPNLIKTYREIDLENHAFVNKLNEIANQSKTTEDFATGIWSLFQDTTDYYEQLLNDGDENLINELYEHYSQQLIIDEDDDGGSATSQNKPKIGVNSKLTKATVTALYHEIINEDFPGGLNALYIKYHAAGVNKQLIGDILENRQEVLRYRQHVRNDSIERLRKATNELYTAMAMRNWQIEKAENQYVLNKENSVYVTEEQQRLSKIRHRAEKIAKPLSHIGGINEGIVPAFAWVKIMLPMWLIAGPIIGTILGVITFVAAYRCNQYTLQESIVGTIMKLFDGSLFMEKDGVTPMTPTKKYVIAFAGVFLGFVVSSLGYYFIGVYAMAGMVAMFGVKIGLVLLLTCSPFAIITGPIIGALFFVGIFKYLSDFDWDLKKAWSNIKVKVSDFFFSPWDEVNWKAKVGICFKKISALFKNVVTVALTGLIVFSTWSCMLTVMAPFVGTYTIIALIVAGLMCVPAAMFGLGKTDFMLSKLTANGMAKLPLQLIAFPIGLIMAFFAIPWGSLAIKTAFKAPFKLVDKLIDAIISPDASYSKTKSAYQAGINQKAGKPAEYTLSEKVTMAAILPNSSGQTILYAMSSSINWVNQAFSWMMNGLSACANFFMSAGPHYEEATTNFDANKMVTLKNIDSEDTAVFTKTTEFYEPSVESTWKKVSSTSSQVKFGFSQPQRSESFASENDDELGYGKYESIQATS